MKLLRNRIKCLACGKVIESYHRHDYKTCGCPNNTMVDGGIVYQRYGGKDMKLVDPRPVYVDNDTFLWGVFDHKLGHTIPHPLSDLEDSHIQNIDLHLRKRYRNRQGLLNKELAKLRYYKDQVIRREHVWPELKRRGLRKINKEIPHSRG